MTSVACYIAGVPCGRLDEYSTKGEAWCGGGEERGHQQSGDQDGGELGISGHAVHFEQGYPQLTSVVPCRHESDTTDLYCIFDPDTAHRLAAWGRDWKDNHRLGQAELMVGALRSQCFSRKSPIRLLPLKTGRASASLQQEPLMKGRHVRQARHTPASASAAGPEHLRLQMQACISGGMVVLVCSFTPDSSEKQRREHGHMCKHHERTTHRSKLAQSC